MRTPKLDFKFRNDPHGSPIKLICRPDPVKAYLNVFAVYRDKDTGEDGFVPLCLSFSYEQADTIAHILGGYLNIPVEYEERGQG